jgi:transposase-like protein
MLQRASVPDASGLVKPLKSAAAEAYLRGEGSLLDLCKKFKIRRETQLRDWITLYNKGHIDPRVGYANMRNMALTVSRTGEENANRWKP